MKWVLFGLATIIGVPVFTGLATWRPARRCLLAALVFSTVAKISVNFFSMELYRGADRGFEVHLTDLLTLGLACGMLLGNFRQLKWLPFNAPLLAAFALALTLSTITAASPWLAGFTLFKMLKGFVLYWTVYNAVRLDGLEPIWWGAVAAAGVLTLAICYQKYGQGLYRPGGTFDHSNTVPAYSLLLLPFLLNWLMHTQSRSVWRLTVAMLAVMGLSFCVAATLSRTGAALLAACILGTLGYSWLRMPMTWRRCGVSCLLLICMTAGAIKASDTLIARFLHAPPASGEARDEFNHAARMMARNHVFGVGLNCFSRVLTNTPEYRDHIHIMRHEEQAGVCHHIYWLAAAEIGWVGFAIFLIVIARFWLRILPTCVAATSAQHTQLLGLATGVLCLHLIGLYEWVLRLTPVLNLFLIVTAASIALCESLATQGARGRHWEPWLRRLPRPAVSTAWSTAP